VYLHKATGLLFLGHPRTASRAVRDALYSIDFEDLGSHHDGPEQGYDLSPYTTFCVVRNHWDAMVSWWYNARMERKEVKPSLKWLAIHISKNQYYFRPGRMFWFLEQVPDIIVLRYESLAADLNALLTVHGLPKVEIPKVGVSYGRKGRHYREYFGGHEAQFIHWCFKPEILELGYFFDGHTNQGVEDA
jgi:hypothetical protein